MMFRFLIFRAATSRREFREFTIVFITARARILLMICRNFTLICLKFKPTVFASLPRFFEKIYAKVVSEFGANASEQNLKDAFGGNVRLLTSGGAPLPNEIAAVFCRQKFADLAGLRFDGKYLRRV